MPGIITLINFWKGVCLMSQLTQTELETLRKVIGEHGMIVNKLEAYAEQAQDPEFKSILQFDAQDARNAKQQLMSFLQ